MIGTSCIYTPRSYYPCFPVTAAEGRLSALDHPHLCSVALLVEVGVPALCAVGLLLLLGICAVLLTLLPSILLLSVGLCTIGPLLLLLLLLLLLGVCIVLLGLLPPILLLAVRLVVTLLAGGMVVTLLAVRLLAMGTRLAAGWLAQQLLACNGERPSLVHVGNHLCAMMYSTFQTLRCSRAAVSVPVSSRPPSWPAMPGFCAPL